MDPINYQTVDPSAAILNGIKMSAGLQGMQQDAQTYQVKLQQQQAAQQQALQQQTDLRALATNPNAGHADYAAMMTKYPAIAEHVGKAFKVLDEGQQQNALQFNTRVYSAQLSGNNELAAQMYRDRAKADPAGAQHYNMLADLVEHSPSSARTIAALGLAGSMGPDKFATAFTNLGTDARAEQEQPAKLRTATATADKTVAEATEQKVKAANAPEAAILGNQNIASQITERAQRLGLDRDKLTTETQLKLTELNQKANTLDDGARKIINDSTVASVTANQSAGQMTDLANRLEKEAPASGLGAKASEWIKSATGNQNAITQMRQEYTRLRTTQAIKMLPPGPASDKDVQLAMKGFPEDTADPATMASFLRGMAKMQQRESAIEGARAEWVNAVGHSGKPKTDIEIDGTKVPAGTTFPDFMKQYLPKTQQAQQVQGRSYMRWATPQAPQTGGATGGY